MQNDENVKRVLTFAPLSLIIYSRDEAKRVPTQAGSSHGSGVGAGPTNKSVDPDWYAEPNGELKGVASQRGADQEGSSIFFIFFKKGIDF